MNHDHRRLRLNASVYNALRQLGSYADSDETPEVKRMVELYKAAEALLNGPDPNDKALLAAISEIENDDEVVQIAAYPEKDPDSDDDSACSESGPVITEEAQEVPPFDELVTFDDDPCKELCDMIHWYRNAVEQPENLQTLHRSSRTRVQGSKNVRAWEDMHKVHRCRFCNRAVALERTMYHVTPPKQGNNTTDTKK